MYNPLNKINIFLVRLVKYNLKFKYIKLIFRYKRQTNITNLSQIKLFLKLFYITFVNKVELVNYDKNYN